MLAQVRIQVPRFTPPLSIWRGMHPQMLPGQGTAFDPLLRTFLTPPSSPQGARLDRQIVVAYERQLDKSFATLPDEVIVWSALMACMHDRFIESLNLQMP